MSDPDELSDDLGYTYMVWVDGVKVAAVRTFPNAVNVADMYRAKGLINVIVDAEKKKDRKNSNMKENSNG